MAVSCCYVNNLLFSQGFAELRLVLSPCISLTQSSVETLSPCVYLTPVSYSNCIRCSTRYLCNALEALNKTGHIGLSEGILSHSKFPISVTSHTVYMSLCVSYKGRMLLATSHLLNDDVEAADLWDSVYTLI